VALSEADKQRVRAHLGYPRIDPAIALMHGFPILHDTRYWLDVAMGKIQDDGIPRVLDLLDKMDVIEGRLFDASERLAARKVGSIELNATEPDQLEDEYARWGQRLAEMFGVSPYWESDRYRRARSGGMNVRVRH
jgi:hypothetical protein